MYIGFIMRINLRSFVNKEPVSASFTITERLPYYVNAPCLVDCIYQLEKEDDYYLLILQLKIKANITCQRCLSSFEDEYQHETKIALCRREQRAEQLLSKFDTIVIPEDEIDLLELITDELNLNLPELHLNIENCNPEMKDFLISGKEK